MSDLPVSLFFMVTAGVERERLILLGRACAEGREAEFEYLDVRRRRTRRTVSVLGLGWRPDGWLFLALCALRSGVRLFRLDRTEEIRLGQRSPRPGLGTFDPRAFASEALGEGRGPALLVPMSLEPPLSDLAAVLFPQAFVEEVAPGRRVCHVRASHPQALGRLIRTLGEGAAIEEFRSNRATVQSRVSP